MDSITNSVLPRQMLSFKSKTKEWRKKNIQWAVAKTYFNYSLVRKSITHKMINYKLVDGKLTMSDMKWCLIQII